MWRTTKGDVCGAVQLRVGGVYVVKVYKVIVSVVRVSGVEVSQVEAGKSVE